MFGWLSKVNSWDGRGAFKVYKDNILICNIQIEFQAPAADDDDDDDVDLFGEETEEEKKAAEERAAAIKASGKKKECRFLSCLI